MADANLKIVISKDDAALNELVAQLSAVFGGATVEKAKSTAKAVGDAIANEAKESGKKQTRTAEEIEAAIVAATKNAADIKAAAERDYVALKHEYVQKGLSETRQAIHEEEQSIKASRDAITRATKEGADKETVAVLKAERDKQNARLQGLRSVEKEITGARTFTEQLEKNVYEPINKKEASGGALAALLFGKVGALEKDLKKSEAQVAEHEHKIAANAEQARNVMAAQEAAHAQKVKQISEQITSAKTAERLKELEEQKKSIEQQIAEEKKLTQAKQSEEMLQLQHHQAMLEKELSATKAEHAKENEKSSKEGGGIGSALASGVGVGAALAGFKAIAEATEEEAAAQARLQAATGLTDKALEEASKSAEELGHQYKIGGDQGKEAMAAVGSYTHATGAKLKEQTEDAIILSQKMGVSTEAAAKMLGKAGDPEVAGNLKKLGINLDANASAEERAAAVHIAAMNAKAGVDAANDNASKNTQEIMKETQETVGSLASTFLDSLNPVLKSLLPLIQEVGELLKDVLGPAMKVVTIILTPLFEGLSAMKPVLPALVIGIGALVVAFNLTTISAAALNAVMSVNPFVWIGLAAVALIGIVALLVKHWDEVVATMKKVFSAIADAGGAFLSFLGITSKAEAATKKHTKSIAENKKSLEDIKKATEDAAKATSDYTDALKKNQENQEKSAKEGQDNAIAAIIDIQRKLKTATGSEKAILEERLTQWKQYGKGQVAAQEESDAATEAASKAIGARVDAEDRSAIKAAKKSVKERADAAHAAADQTLADRKDEIAAMDITDRQAKALQKAAELQHAQTLLDNAKLFFTEKSKQYQAAQRQLQSLQIADRKQERADQLADAKTATDNLVTEFNIRADKETMSTKARERGLYAIELQGVSDQIALVQHGSEEEAKLLQQKSAMEAKHGTDERALQISLSKEIAKANLDARKDALEQLKATNVSKDVLIREESAIAIAEEENRYAEEKEARKDDLNDTKLGLALKESLEQNHANKVKAIDAKSAADIRGIQQQQAQFFAGPFVSGMNAGVSKMMNGLHQLTSAWTSSNNLLKNVFGGILDSFIQMIEQMVAKVIENAAVFALMSAFTGGAGSLGGSLLKGVIPGMAEGGILTKPTVLRAGIMTQPTFLAAGGVMPIIGGEAGPEAVIPLSSGRAQSQISNALGMGAGSEMHKVLQSIASNTANPTSVLPVNNALASAQNRYQYATNLRRRG